MELAVGVELMLFAYMVYVSMKSPSDFSSLVVVNPRKPSAAAAPAAKAPPPVTPVAKAPPPAAPVAKAPAPPPVALAEPAPAEEEPAVAASAEPAAEEAAEEIAEEVAAPAPAPQEPRTVVMLKNPETGEIAPLPADYRFAKKWIKDALVSEGLLDRIYKNSELDRKNRTRIREALERLKAMPKYGV